MRRILKLVIDIIEEIILNFTHPIIGFFSSDVDINKNYSPKKSNIIIVERWLNKNSLHNYWIKYLRKKGFGVFHFYHHFQKGNFEDSAVALNNFINSKKLDDVILVGVSAGGITCLTYLNKYGWKGTKKFISLVSPFKGTFWMYLLSFLPSARQLYPNSEFLKNQVNRINKKNKTFCFRALFDEFVPKNSSQIDGSTEVEIDVIGHQNLHMNCKDTYDKIADLAKK